MKTVDVGELCKKLRRLLVMIDAGTVSPPADELAAAALVLDRYGARALAREFAARAVAMRIHRAPPSTK